MWVLALSIPFWVAGAATTVELRPGLPVSALMIVCPLTAASILVYEEGKLQGVADLMKRSVDYKRITAKAWYIPVFFLMPGLMIVAYGLMRV